jgi:hypothetical protein
MNFKPTLLKTILSFVGLMLVDWGMASTFTCLEESCPWYKFLFYGAPIAYGIVAGIIIYLVWSLIQKGKDF